ncbi:MucB/RseB C-terminal domain-containing protein [Glaciimonas sp. CA11.2]|uniref:MucB/RseB C-terminal domain-containing protein n=1 Tax=unclassified Glaciimonas TaxID=2644401 RepID=UPI002AB4CBD5|nr:MULTISPECIES: MucB/RseB C-terminal domain-containing protein [unclassified Glaciimonas]MDY7544952.1 MucB/RseB C-terminal domain-containing protein [Glaciimonas sp. CA11.2]MEB0013255.1 MucB/RseB C-terminal domain-containing protein [Glaciimonas sp. Cout2]MEB0082504.1 MucB/RseB C-terminal domain-containing protein [Glaciimonas sp. Gout2]MEB0162767.1 MucB/RseB C-terminal domain-containing protein [Glaciimonas sp. CA11.2]
MRQTKFLLRFFIILSTLFALSARAEGVTTEKLADNHEAQTLLKRIQSAAQKLNYSGTFVYQQGNQMRTSRITHILEGRNELEKLEVLDGKPREYIRHNEDVTCYMPDTKTLSIEKRVTQDVFPAILASIPSDLTDYYNVKLGESGRVAGHDCQAVLLEPKDKMRYGYKLWAEKKSGLLMRAQTLNNKNEIVEQISFTEIFIGNISRNRIRSSFGNTSSWHVEHSAMSPTNLNEWAVTGMPPGFKKVRELKRVVVDAPAQNSGAAPVRREVSQIVFSDGLAAISVFIEPGSQSRTEGSMQQGALNIVGKRQGDFWLTIVGEVPAVAIRQVANSIELKNK